MQHIKKYWYFMSLPFFLFLFVTYLFLVPNLVKAAPKPPEGALLMMTGATPGYDNLIGASSADWLFSITADQNLVTGDVIQFIFPSSGEIAPFDLSNSSLNDGKTRLYSSLSDPSNNLLYDSSFEELDKYWMTEYSSIPVGTTTDSYHGDSALEYNVTSTNFGIVLNYYEMSSSTDYTYSFYAKTDVPGSVARILVTSNANDDSMCTSTETSANFYEFASSTDNEIDIWGCHDFMDFLGSGEIPSTTAYVKNFNLTDSFERYSFTLSNDEDVGYAMIFLGAGGDNVYIGNQVIYDAIQVEEGSSTTTYSTLEDGYGGESAVGVGYSNNIIYGFVDETILSGARSIFSLGGINNPSFGKMSSFSDLSWRVKAGTPMNSEVPYGTLSSEKFNETATSSLIRGGGSMVVDGYTGVYLSNYNVGESSNYTFKLTPTSSLPVGSKIVLEFPSSYSSLLGGISVSTTQLISIGENTTSTIGSFSTSTSNDGGIRIAMIVSSTAVSAGDPLSLTIYGVTNPAVSGVYGADSAGPGSRFVQYITESNDGLLDGSYDPYQDGDFNSGPPPPSSVIIGGKHTVNILARVKTATTTRNLTVGEKALVQVEMGNPDKGYFIGSRSLDSNSSARYAGLLDGTYMVGSMFKDKRDADSYSSLLSPGMKNLSLLSTEASTVTTTLYFGIPDATTTVALTGGVAGQYAQILAQSGNYQSFSPVYTDTNYDTEGFDSSGNGYAGIRVKSGESWNFSVMSGESFGQNTNFSSGTTKYWPPSIPSSYISESGTSTLGSFAYVEADKNLVVSLKYSGTDTSVTNACVGVKRTGGGMFMGEQDVVCQPNSGSDYQFKVPAGSISVTVNRPGTGKPDEYPIAIKNTTTTKTLYLSGVDNYINVTVEDSNGNTISNASVFAHGSGFGQGMTGSTGTTTLYVPVGTYSVDGFAPGFGPLDRETGVVVGDDTNPSVTFTLNATNLRTVTGRVTQSGSGVSGVKIGAHGIGSSKGGNGTETDFDGYYTLYLPAGTYEIGGWSDTTGGLNPQTVDVTSGNSTGKNWTINGQGTLRVTLNNASNLTDLNVGAFNESTGRGNGTKTWTTSGTSKIAILILPAGSYKIGAGSPATGPIIDGEDITITADQTTNVVGNAEANADLVTVSGRVSVDGSGMSNVNVWASRKNGTRFFSDSTDASGDYNFEVPVSGDYMIGVKTAGYIASSCDESITVTTTDYTKNFTLVATTLTISGQVTNGSDGISNGGIMAKKIVNGNECWVGGAIDNSGRYSLDVSSGDWKVFAEAPGYGRSAGTVVTAGDTQNITLSAISGWSRPVPHMQGITDTSGGQISTSQMVLNLPANSLGTNSSMITVSVASTTPRTASNATALKNSTISISATNSSGQSISSLNSDASLTLDLDSDDLIELKIPESDVQFAYYDETALKWEPMSATIDTVNHKLSVQTSHFTDFAPIVGGPDAPSGLAVDNSTALQLDLTWNASIATTTYYLVYASATDISAFPTSTLLATTTETSYSHTGLTAGNTWYYKVAALNDTGEGVNSSRAYATVAGGSCDSLTGAATYNSYPTCGAATCSSGYTLSGSGASGTCVVSSGGGGGSVPAVTYPNLATTPASVEGGNQAQTRNITLKLDASNVSYLAISEDENFVGASWVNYEDSLEHVLSSGVGEKTLYIKFKSSDGGVSNVQKLTIELLSDIVAENENNEEEVEAVVEKVKETVKKVVSYVFDNYLYIGNSGEEVKNLQTLLKDLGYFTYPTITGYFGTVTKQAVVAYQKAKGLAPYPGWLGPQTRKTLSGEKGQVQAQNSTQKQPASSADKAQEKASVKSNLKYKFENRLSPGISNEEVKNLQLLLKDLGYFSYPTATGYYGSITTKAVADFQRAYDKAPYNKKYNLKPYPGFVGPNTLGLLNELAE